ncbi:hypothetical protein VL763_08575 [Listeria seeligeri]|uniref:hypothetical protein n=1 Tax=Listeria seeligeri TaxID=1640 RepID=UPI002F42B989
MAIKTFNYTGDAYIEAADTRSEIGALVGGAGSGFFGSIEQIGTTNSYTVKSGSVVFVGGLCVRVLSDEVFDLTSATYIVVETSYQTITDAYTCGLKVVNTVDSSTKVGAVNKHTTIYQKGVGVINEASGTADLLKKVSRADRLYSGSSYMDDGQKITFPNLETNGYQTLYLVFSHYTVGTGADDWGWAIYSVPVKYIKEHPSAGHSIPITVEDTTKTMYKYVYINLTQVMGASNNVRTLDGVNFRTKCLREIWGVG